VERVSDSTFVTNPRGVVLKPDRVIARMKQSGKIVAKALDEVCAAVCPGVTTAELDAVAEETIVSFKGARPAFKGYHGFPSTLCVSINDEVVHGIPTKSRSLREGDIVSIDVGASLGGYFADGAVTVPVGKVPEEVASFLRVTEMALEKGISKARPGNRLGDISAAIQSVAERNGYSVVRSLVGHGIGANLHEEPPVPNFGLPNTGIELKEGLVLAIEPMLNMGGYGVRTRDDRWTVVTLDGSVSAHFEHTVAITGNGPLVITSNNGDVTQRGC